MHPIYERGQRLRFTHVSEGRVEIVTFGMASQVDRLTCLVQNQQGNTIRVGYQTLSLAYSPLEHDLGWVE